MDNIFIVDKISLNKKIKKCAEDGKDNLHIITDFDRTMTRRAVNGKKINTTFAHIEKNDLMPENFRRYAEYLYNIYHPIDISQTIPKEEKEKKLIEWWYKIMDAMNKYGMNTDIIDTIIKNKEIHVRDGTFKTLDTLKKHEIPLLILSAGLGNIITAYLESEKKLHSNIHIISNFITFCKEGKMDGYEPEIIFPCNKSEAAVKNQPYCSQIEKRKNVILIGDSIEDSEMADGLNHNIVIKIGFLNNKKEERLDRYKEVYDVVILDDGSMDYVNYLLKKILNLINI